MAEILNLRQERKRRERAEHARKGTENARRFGRTRAERRQDDHEAEKAARDLDGHRLERSLPDGSSQDTQGNPPAAVRDEEAGGE